jgi:hypothetical protein
MRTLLAALLLLVLSAHGHACDCFPPELRAKTARDALQIAHLAVYARVVEVRASGAARVLVLESFKGPASGSAIEVLPSLGQCVAPPFSVGEEALILAFEAPVTACHKLAPEHYLLGAFRSNAAK